MTNSELQKSLSTRLGIPQTEIKHILESSARIIMEYLDKDMIITIPGLGLFRVVLKKKRKSYNPQQKCFMLLPLKRVVKFRASASLKEALKNRRL